MALLVCGSSTCLSKTKNVNWNLFRRCAFEELLLVSQFKPRRKLQKRLWELFSGGGKPSSSTPADGTRSKSLFASEGRNNGTSSAAARSTAVVNSLRVPSTPKFSKTQATAGTPSKVLATPLLSRARATVAAAATPSNRRSSLSSSSSYSSASSSNSIQ